MSGINRSAGSGAPSQRIPSQPQQQAPQAQTPQLAGSTSVQGGEAPAQPTPKAFVPRRSVAADPLRRPQPRQRRPRPPTEARPPIANGPTPSLQARLQQQNILVEKAKEEAQAEDDPKNWTEYPLITTKASLLKGLRHHVMRLAAKKPIDPSDPNEFTRPVRLHRRDPRLQPPGKEGEDPAKQPDDGLTPEERAKQEAERIAKEKEREEILASIAPSKGERSASKRNPFKKKTMQVFHKDENDRKLRYEEYFPWHIEDFDYKNTWVGNLESGLSNGSYAMFVMKERSFQMVPIEKWYKFTQRNVFKNFTIEEAENLLKKKAKPSRWLMDDLIKKLDPEAGENGQAGIKSEPRAQRGMFLVKGERLKQPKKEIADADELDFEDDFQDDEEAPIMDGDEEENKATEKRIKKEYLGANVFDTKDEKEYEEEERENRLLEEMRKKGGKKVKKYLKSLEKNNTYESDSDGNPYFSSEDSDSTIDEEAARAEEEKRKKEKEAEEEELRKLQIDKEQRQAQLAAQNGAAGSKRPSPPGSRTDSPAPQKKARTDDARPTPPPGAKIKKRKGGDGVGSDYDTGAETDGNGSGIRKKAKVAGLQPGSRGASRGASPGTPSGTPGPVSVLTEQEIIDLFKQNGLDKAISVKEMTSAFKSKVSTKESKGHFIALIKKITRHNNNMLWLKKEYGGTSY